MTRAEARQELERLAQGLGLPISGKGGLTDEQLASWLRVLAGSPRERAKSAVDKLIDTWSTRQWPTRGDYVRAAASLEGAPNAGAYMTGSDASWHRKPEAAYAIWRQTQIESMDDEDRYWDYVHDPIFRDAQDREWRQQWERQMRGLAAV